MFKIGDPIMSAIHEETTDDKCLSLTDPTGAPLENICEVNNISYRLQTSYNSTISNDSEVSLLSLSMENEIDSNVKRTDIDELPAFEIRLISPLGRTPSPIDNEEIVTPTRPLPLLHQRLTSSSCRNNPDYVPLHDINAQISPPGEHGDEDELSLSRTSSLETIFEGVFLNTPPRQRYNFQNNRNCRNRTNLLEKVAINRLNSSKENQSPLSESDTHSNKKNYNDLECVTNACCSRFEL